MKLKLVLADLMLILFFVINLCSITSATLIIVGCVAEIIGGHISNFFGGQSTFTVTLGSFVFMFLTLPILTSLVKKMDEMIRLRDALYRGENENLIWIPVKSIFYFSITVVPFILLLTLNQPSIMTLPILIFCLILIICYNARKIINYLKITPA